MKHFVLNGRGKRGGKALNVHLLCVLSDRLHEQLMTLLVCESDYLVLYRRAVARTGARDVSGEESTFFYVVFYYFVCVCVCVNDVAGDLLARVKLSFVGEDRVGSNVFLTRLLLKN